MKLDKAIEILERNLQVGKGRLDITYKPYPYQISDATISVLAEIRRLSLGTVEQSMPLTQRADYIKGWEDGVDFNRSEQPPSDKEVMSAEEFYNSLENKPDFTKLTKTGISSNYKNAFDFAEAYADHLQKTKEPKR